MIGRIKGKIREYLTAGYDSQYRQELNEKVTSYDTWIREKEKQNHSKESMDREQIRKKIEIISYEDLQNLENFVPQSQKETGVSQKEIVLLVQDKAAVTFETLQKITSVFETKPEARVVYTDEDELNHEETVRMNPWLKPDYSPQTLLSYFYFGNLVAVRRAAFEEAVLRFLDKQSCKEMLKAPVPERVISYRRALYTLILEICKDLKREQAVHIKEPLYSSHCIKSWGFEEEYRDIRQYYNSLLEREPWKGVSIIIPSKDNPDILERCLKSIRYWTKEITYEILVVDNGSSEINREKIKELKVKYNFKFLYEPMEFNFSRMCNLGAKAAGYELLLFLNDDCEVRGSRWLSHMADLAAVKRNGAVGAKLYYPDSKRLQHCGIYNLHLGPVHKLQFKEDVRAYYDRRNLDVRNVLAVTAACLMIRKEVFSVMNGFDETLQVAFNDVDICYRLYEAGYDNVIDNEIHLWHHESLSRGNDETKEKLERLQAEKQRLYEKHRALWENDPYYHPWFTGELLDTGYSFFYEYEAKKELELEHPVKLMAFPKGTRIENCVVPMVEYAGNLKGWFLEEQRIRKITERLSGKEVFYLQGNLVVLGSDNACYEKTIVLRHEKTGALFQVIPTWQYRPDIFTNLPDQKNVGLSGFCCLVDFSEMPEGRYELGFLVMDKISKQYLLRITTRSIENGRDKL